MASQVRVFLSYSSVDALLARRLALDLRASNLDVWLVTLDQWEGGGHAPARQSAVTTVGDAAFVVPLLTPSAAARTWIGNEWREAIGATQAMLAGIAPIFPHLVDETVPKTVPLFVLTDVLRRLVAEGISIRDLRRILLALADWGRIERDPLYLTEYARAALKRQITHRFTRGSKGLFVFLLDPALEEAIRGAMRHTATGTYVDLEPERLRSIVDAIARAAMALRKGIQTPQVLTTMEIRSSVRRLVAPSLPWLDVTSYQELTPDLNIQPVARIGFDDFSPRAVVDTTGVSVWR